MSVSVFQRCGGFSAISTMVMAFYKKVLASEVTSAYFDGVDLRRLIDHQTKFLAAVMGGPASYSDETLHLIHARLAITQAAFDEAIGLLEETLGESGLGDGDIREVIAVLRSKAGMIVTGRA